MTDQPVHNVLPALLDRRVPIDALDPHPKNARRRTERGHEEIRRSLRGNGQYKAITVRQLASGRLQILTGHGTVDAAIAEGWTHIAADVHDGISDQVAARIVAVDNRTTDLSADDDEMILALLEDARGAGELDGTGWSEDELAALEDSLRDPEAPVSLTDPDEIPDLPAAPASAEGDVWLLGPHRLVVGDSTLDATWSALLPDHELLDAVWTDPPYGVSYQAGLTPEQARKLHRRTDGLEVKNDRLTGAQLAELLRAALGRAKAATRPGGAWYVAYADRTGSVIPFLTVLDAELGVYRHSIAWVKDRFILGQGDYHSRYEPMAYGWHPGGPRLVPLEDRTQDTVWEIARPARSADHPTTKPVDLVARCLTNSTREGAVVGDPFAGSGTTLIAAHRLGRVARLIELDPRYADVICRRWQEHTGVVPVLESTGVERSFTA